MKWLAGLRKRSRAVASTALPSLRVIGMAYTGLIGVGAAALVVSVAFLPVAPVLQQATQPALDAVVNLVQPATEVVTSLISTRPPPREPRWLFTPEPQVALASPPTIAETLPDDAAPATPIAHPVAAGVAAAPVTLAPVAKASVSRSADDETSAPLAEDVPAEPDQAVEARDRTPVREVAVVLVDTPTVQQEANVEAPRPLAPVASPTEAAWQTKARLDVENQTAIDAAKASVVRRKAEADTANQAAIDIGKYTTPNVAAAPTPTETVGPTRPLLVLGQTTPVAPTVPIASPQTNVPASADNQTLIDVARASKLRARAEANAANQAAIDAARAPRSTVTPTPTPKQPPAPSTPTPALVPTVEPTPTSALAKTVDLVSLEILEDQPIDLEEMPVTLALDKDSDVAR